MQPKIVYSLVNDVFGTDHSYIDIKNEVYKTEKSLFGAKNKDCETLVNILNEIS